ncbi:MAG: alpha/beta fold hydrolase [Vulcanimicrobiota bacterium]
MMNDSGTYLSIPWGKVRYLERGRGIPLLLLHSNGGTLEGWSLNMTELGRYYRVIALDIPGYGQSDPVEGEPGIESLASAVMKVLDTLEIKKTHIAGNSLGGILALEIAAEHPERTGKLVLIGTPCGEEHELQKLLAILSKWEKEKDLAQITEEEGAGITPKINATLVKLINSNLKMAGSSFFQVNRSMASYPFKEQLEKVRNESLIIWGDQDGIASINNAWLLSRSLHGAPVHLIKGAGHSPQFDEPQSFNSLVIKFLRNKAKTSRSGV